MERATKKRVIILAINLLVLSTFFVLSFFVFFRTNLVEISLKERPSISFLQVQWVEFLDGRNNTIDLVARIRNPNTEWGAEKIFYTFTLKDAANKDVKSLKGTAYILPKQTSFVVIPRVNISSSNIKDIHLDITGVRWRKFSNFIKLDLNVKDIILTNPTNDPEFKTQLSALIINNSLFGLQDIKVIGVLFNQLKNPIAVNTGAIQTVLSGERRGVEMFWPYIISGSDFSNIEIEAYSNVFEHQNFVKQFGTTEIIEETYTKSGVQEIRQPDVFRLPGFIEDIRGWF